MRAPPGAVRVRQAHSETRRRPPFLTLPSPHMLTPTLTAATGFLLAVLWFDLMFDTQMLPHRDAAVAPDTILASIAAYYRRVTTDASPMGRLVSIVMLVLIAALIAQALRSDAPVWVSVVS